MVKFIFFLLAFLLHDIGLRSERLGERLHLVSDKSICRLNGDPFGSTRLLLKSFRLLAHVCQRKTLSLGSVALNDRGERIQRRNQRPGVTVDRI